jgi:hypothetical protein
MLSIVPLSSFLDIDSAIPSVNDIPNNISNSLDNILDIQFFDMIIGRFNFKTSTYRVPHESL